LGQQGKVVTQKIPGWGLATAMIIETRQAPDGRTEACILPSDHEAPFWVDLREVAHHKGRIIYDDEALLIDATDADSSNASD
jgi:hypothetical protein